jgi:hypothetical protein
MMAMHLGQHFDFLVLLVQQVLELSDLALERPHSLLKRFRIASGKGTATEFVTGAAFEPDVGTL